MKLRAIFTGLATASLIASAHAGSTVNPNVPALNEKLNSPPIQTNFQAAYNDINNLLGKYAATVAPTNPANFQEWADLSGSPAAVFKYWNAGTATWVPYASLNILTSAYTPYSTSTGFLATVPITVSVAGGIVTYGLATDSNFQVLNNKLALANGVSGSLLCNSGSVSAEIAVCTWTAFADRAISATNGSLPYRTGGAWGMASTGSAGHTIPFLDTSNTWAALQAVYPGTASLRTAAAGVLFRVAQIDGTAAAVQQDTFGAPGAYQCTRSDGTAAASTALTAGDQICSFGGHGYDGVTNSSVSAAFSLYAAQTWSNGAHGSYARVATTANGSVAPVEQFGVEQDGGLVAPANVTGGSQGAGSLNLSGNVFINGSPYNFTNIAGLVSATQMPAFSGDVASSAGSTATTIQAAAVSFAKFQNLAALSLFGNCTAVAATGTNVTGTANQILRVNSAGTACGFGTIDLSQATAVTGTLQAASEPAHSGDVTNSAGSLVLSIGANKVTNAQLAQGAALTIKGNPTASPANEQDLTLDPSLGFSGTTVRCMTGTVSQVGCLKPDGTTITVDGTGTIVAVGAAATSIADGTTSISSGVASTYLFNNGGKLGHVAPASKSVQQAASDTSAVVTPAQQQSHPSAAKAWVTMTGSTGANAGSTNISTTSRSAAGTYSVNFTTPFTSAAYACSITATANTFVVTPQLLVKSATGVTFQTYNNQAAALADPTSVDLLCFGTQ